MSGQIQPPTSAPTPPQLPPLLTSAQATTLLDEVIYEQILECIDLDAVCDVARSLDAMVGELDGLSDDGVGDLARSILDRALDRLPQDLRGYLRASEWTAEDDCILCQEEAREAHRRTATPAAAPASTGDTRAKRPHT